MASKISRSASCFASCSFIYYIYSLPAEQPIHPKQLRGILADRCALLHLTRPPEDGHGGLFQYFAIINKAAGNVLLHRSVCTWEGKSVG